MTRLQHSVDSTIVSSLNYIFVFGFFSKFNFSLVYSYALVISLFFFLLFFFDNLVETSEEFCNTSRGRARNDISVN